MKTLNTSLDIPKIKKGQKINLIQVTTKASILGYVDLDLFFHAKEGPVKIRVEAYMTTPLILGNDFASQYSLSVKWVKGKSCLEFGDSGQSLDIANLVSFEFINEDGHTLKFEGLA